MTRLIVLLLFVVTLIVPPVVVAQPSSVECTTPPQLLNPYRSNLAGFVPINAQTPIGTIEAYYHDPSLRCWGYFVALHVCGGTPITMFMTRSQVDALGWH